MWVAVCDGDAKKLGELMKRAPSFNVNASKDAYGWALLHYACVGNERTPVIPLLLTHPDIDVNLKTLFGCTPYYYAAARGHTSCVREMLTDSRVKVNERDKNGETPLRWAAYYGHLDVIQWWIASGKDVDLGTPGDVDKTDAVGAAKKKGKTEVVTLLERFKENPDETRHMMRVELGWYSSTAAQMFALMVFVSDGLLQINDTTTPSPAARFFNIVKQLPLELQMVLCFRQVGSAKEIISGKDGEVAFKELARRLW